MSASYWATTSPRTTEPDIISLINMLRTSVNSSIGVQHTFGTNSYTLKSSVALTAVQKTTAQGIIDISPPVSDKLAAKNRVDLWPLEMRALLSLNKITIAELKIEIDKL